MIEDKQKKRHIKYFIHCLGILPGRYGSYDSQRLVLTQFAVGGLSLLGGLDALKNKDEIIEWIYTLQSPTGGFFGSEIMKDLNKNLAQAHIASTFAALQVLLILGDDLSRVDVGRLMLWVSDLQTSSGSFLGAGDFQEGADTRFSYCAAFIFHLFGNKNNFSQEKVEKAVDYIIQCQSPDSSFGQVPGSEGHGALTFCALAALKLFGYGNILTKSESARIARFCLNRQRKGIHGRPHKDDDSCYTFWTCAALKLANPKIKLVDQVDVEKVLDFVDSCCDSIVGGVSKYPGNPPDPTHSFLALAGLGVISGQVMPEYMMSKNIVKHLLRTRREIKERLKINSDSIRCTKSEIS